jgi:MFS family permease
MVVNKEKALAERPNKKVPAALVLFMMLMSMTAGAMCLNKVPPILPLLTEGMGLTGASLAGLLISVFVFSGIFLAIPSGAIIARFGYYKVGIVALCALLLGSVVGAFNLGYEVMLTSRIIEGIGLILLMTLGPAAVGSVFTDAKRGSAMGLLMCFMAFGQIAMFNLAPRIASIASWTVVWWVTAAYAVLFLVIWVFALHNLDLTLEANSAEASKIAKNVEAQTQDDAQASEQAQFASSDAALVTQGGAAPTATTIPAPESAPTATPIPAPESAPAPTVTKSRFRDLLLNPGLWLIGFTLLLYLVAEQGVISFLPTFLTDIRGMDVAEASTIVSIAPLVGIPVGIVVGVISDKLGSRKWPLGILMVASAITYALMPTWATGSFLVLVILFGIAVMGIVGLCFAALSELVPPSQGGMAVGILNTFQWVGIFLSSTLVGVLIEQFGWDAMFYVLVGITIVGALCTFVAPKLR